MYIGYVSQKKAETKQFLILLSAVVMQEKKQQFTYHSLIFNSYVNSQKNAKGQQFCKEDHIETTY